MARRLEVRLYDDQNAPAQHFNAKVLGWLKGDIAIREHKPPAAFDGLRDHYDATFAAANESGEIEHAEVHRELLSNLTDLMNGVDLTDELRKRLPDATINAGGTRSTLSQGLMKNSGENFVNAIVYAIADGLKHQDEVLVDKGTPPFLRPHLRMERNFQGPLEQRTMELVVESDFCIFRRSNPLDAIVCSAKTRLKEVFHIGTMWKLFFDVLDDAHCKDKWGLSGIGGTSSIDYVFVTADNIREGGKGSQGPDLKESGVRNLLALDASFFDYVFVSKTGLSYVSGTLDYQVGREALFHELGCLIDMIEQKFGGDCFAR